MRVLLDNCVDIRFGELITGHEATHSRQLGWGKLANGELLRVAEDAGFDVIVTVDKNMQHQQSFKKRTISLITLNSQLAIFKYIAPLAPRVSAVLDEGLAPGSKLVIDALKGRNQV